MSGCVGTLVQRMQADLLSGNMYAKQYWMNVYCAQGTRGGNIVRILSRHCHYMSTLHRFHSISLVLLSDMKNTNSTVSGNEDPG